jgi:hypothetical protein
MADNQLNRMGLAPTTTHTGGTAHPIRFAARAGTVHHNLTLMHTGSVDARSIISTQLDISNLLTLGRLHLALTIETGNSTNSLVSDILFLRGHKHLLNLAGDRPQSHQK